MKDPDRAWVWLAPLLAAVAAAIVWGIVAAFNAPPGSPVSIGVRVEESRPGDLHPWTLTIDAQSVFIWTLAGLLAAIVGLAILGWRRRAAKTPQDRD